MGAIGYLIHVTLALVILNKEVERTSGMMYPRESETREVRTLDGIWNFVKSEDTNPTQGVREKWYKDDLSKVSKLHFHSASIRKHFFILQLKTSGKTNHTNACAGKL